MHHVASKPPPCRKVRGLMCFNSGKMELQLLLSLLLLLLLSSFLLLSLFLLLWLFLLLMLLLSFCSWIPRCLRIRVVRSSVNFKIFFISELFFFLTWIF